MMTTSIEIRSLSPAEDSILSEGTDQSSEGLLHLVHEKYARRLQESLSERTELILDFTSLQVCLDPQSEHLKLLQENDEKFNYKEFLSTLFAQDEKLQSLVTLKVRAWTNPEFDLMKNITNSCTLTELDLAGNKFSKEEQENLNFWSLPQLKVLKLDQTDLVELPGSVGRLQNLQELGLSRNKLTDLPITLENCKSLKKLSLNGNSFRAIPGVVLKLKALEDLRRLGNPLLERFNMADHPHITALLVKSSSKGPWNPTSLQSLAARAVSSLTLAGEVDYWDNHLLPPRQCKLMDRLAPSYKYCEHCCKTVTDTVYRVDILMLRFAGNVHVPFSFSACSETCKDAIVSEYTILQNETQKQIDRDYDEEMKQAQQRINNGEVVDTKMDVPDHQIDHFVAPNYRAIDYMRGRTRRRKRCSIM